MSKINTIHTLAQRRIDIAKSQFQDTGLISGGELEIDVDTTLILVPAGTGQIVDYSGDPANPTVTQVAWATQTIAPLNIGTNTTGHIYVDSTGTILQKLAALTHKERRNFVHLGRWASTDHVNVIVAQSEPEMAIHVAQTLYDLYHAIGLINNGIHVLPAGATLGVARTAGSLISVGISWGDGDHEMPNVRNIAAADPVTTIFKATQLSAVDAAHVAVLDPLNYDDGGVVTVISGSANRATNQRLYQFPSGNLIVQYGQTVHSNLADALGALLTESFTVLPTVIGEAILVGILSVTKGATELDDDVTAVFTSVSKFGEISGASNAVSSGFVGTPGSVPFAGVGGALIEDNTNLFFDDTLNQLRVRSTPVALFQSHKFTASGVHDFLTGLTAEQLVQVSIGTRDLTLGSLDILVDNIVKQTVVADSEFSSVYAPSVSLAIRAGATPYDIATGVFTDPVLSVAAQEANPQAMLYNDDGSKLYVIGISQDSVQEYTLSIAYDIASGVFTGTVLDVSAQETSPRSMQYNGDGTVLYVMGDVSDNIHAYTMTTPYDIFTATFSATVLSVAAQETAPSDFIFNNDGSKLYVIGTSADAVQEYTLSPNYNVASGVYTGTVLDVSPEELNPHSMMFNGDGTTLYVLGISEDAIQEYAMTIPYDIFTATHVQQALDVSAQETAPLSMMFNNDGTKLYVLGVINDTIFEYSLTAPYTGEALATVIRGI